MFTSYKSELTEYQGIKGYYFFTKDEDGKYWVNGKPAFGSKETNRFGMRVFHESVNVVPKNLKYKTEKFCINGTGECEAIK